MISVVRSLSGCSHAQDSGVRIKEPFSTLARHRKGPRGRIDFGEHDLSSLSRISSEEAYRRISNNQACI